jgi:hypothetical protein
MLKLCSKTPRNLFGEAFYLAELFGIGPDDLILSNGKIDRRRIKEPLAPPRRSRVTG